MKNDNFDARSSTNLAVFSTDAQASRPMSEPSPHLQTVEDWGKCTKSVQPGVKHAGVDFGMPDQSHKFAMLGSIQVLTK